MLADISRSDCLKGSNITVQAEYPGSLTQPTLRWDALPDIPSRFVSMRRWTGHSVRGCAYGSGRAASAGDQRHLACRRRNGVRRPPEVGRPSVRHRLTAAQTTHPSVRCMSRRMRAHTLKLDNLSWRVVCPACLEEPAHRNRLFDTIEVCQRQSPVRPDTCRHRALCAQEWTGTSGDPAAARRLDAKARRWKQLHR
jgi:hypothetical protein